MLARHVSRHQCVTLPQTRLASTVRPTKHPVTVAAQNNGVHSFFHHFAPFQLPRTESAKRTTLKQHLQQCARERKEKLNSDPAKIKSTLVKKQDVATPPLRTETVVYKTANKKLGRSRKAADVVAADAPIEKPKATKQVNGPVNAEAPRIRRRLLALKEGELPPRLALRDDQAKHHDLGSFLAYAAGRNMDPASTVYRGTNYEYAVQQALASYHFKLRRTGKANDLGIDLLGEWSLPREMAGGDLPREFQVLVQCKLSTGRPCNVRELEGAYVGAPAGWRGTGVMAFLVSAKPATFGVRGALQRSRLPMGFLQITEDGQVQQFIWNNVAQEARLTGMSTTHAYSTTPGSSNKPQAQIALVYQGRPV